MRSASIINLACVVVSAGLLLGACSPESGDGSNETRAARAPMEESAHANGAYPTSGPTLMGSLDAAPLPQTLPALATDADVIALVEPETQLPDLWDSNGTIVTSRYRAQVVKVVKGDVAPGEVITLHANGGTMAATFAATSSQRPVPGEPTRVLQYVDSPFYHIGVEELVFLVRVYSTDPGIGTIYWADGPGARYNVVDGRLVSIFPGEVKASISEGAAIRKEVEGMTLDELAAGVSP